MAELPPFASALGDGIWCIDTGYHRPHYDAAYLLVDSGRAAFCDTGTNFAVPRLLATLQALGLARDAVDWVIPSHVHLDHAGGAGLLMQRAAQPHACCCTRAACATWSTRRRCSRRCWRSTAPKRWRATTARCCRWTPNASPPPRTAWS